MISLYSKLRESLLDDDDEVMARGDEGVLNNSFDEIDQLFASFSRNNKIRRSFKDVRQKSFIKDDTFYAVDYEYVGWNVDYLKKLKELLNLFNYDKKLTTFDSKNTTKFEHIRTVNPQNAIFTTYNTGRIMFKNVDNVEDININIIDNSKLEPFVFKVDSWDTVKFTNVNINVDKQIGGGYDYFKRIYSESFLIFKNCDIKNIKSIQMYSPFMFDHDSVINKFNDILDTDHIVNYTDSLGKKITPRKTNIKKIIAAVNNYKKYIFDSSDNDRILKFKPDFKLKDFIDIDCFDDNLNSIQIKNNNVCFEFIKQIHTLKTDLKIPTVIELPNDNWVCSVYKVK